jgi:hypothetical protein
MHGNMGGWHEIRLTGLSREQFRLFCIIENAADDELLKLGLKKPAIAHDESAGKVERHQQRFPYGLPARDS